ncbi:ZZ type zinc finger domain-containing protein [Ophiocordyceps sinensis CO18]|uniref:ZZ type zinc finger domain-containing protein n=1 Tax=Ophiocordyceps sinensis (strain Co18 / CGMCC 3.14243) TaxID=911162 RepID=T5AB44_OPHSC|nr:ZZ type zinc finger domain-containing protein [Ophiocordyceps sinensis CO18]
MSALAHHVGLDAPVTLKVFYDGATRRAKMPLREMVPRILEKHVRTFLHIPDDSKIMIERYSDSAAAYVLLDSADVSVYKQLYRAAKAKSKLKLRVSVIGKEDKADLKTAPVGQGSESSMVPAEPAFSAKTEITTPVVKSELPTHALKTEISTPAAMLPTEPPVMKLAVRTAGPVAAQSTTPSKVTGKASTQPREWSKEFQSRMKDIKQTTDDLADLACQLQWQGPSPTADKLLSKPDVAVASKPTGATTGNEAVISKPTSLCTAKDNDAAVPNKPVPSGPAQGNEVFLLNKPATSCSARGGFAVCCNRCEKTIPDAHYHCSTCDDGDFDLCQSCVSAGDTCYNDGHWLIKRMMKNGQLVNSTTDPIVSWPKSKAHDKEEPKKIVSITHDYASDVFGKPIVPRTAVDSASTRGACLSNMRTCNCCVQELPEREFLHCKTCEDYDLCQACFANDAHGHHPNHGFVPAVPGAQMPDHIKAKMRPGRNQIHHAICDGCDKYITGVRHKCLDCPDWDYCSECVLNVHFVHANHRFAPIYEPLANTQAWPAAQPIHVGICCDGPLCSVSQAYPSYIRGVRYKCAVCHDLDFCASCEAHPGNHHNKTHPLIKFKTPVRHVSVTTTGERQDGKRMPAMGDRMGSKSPETASPSDKNTMNAVQTVVEMKPQEPASVPKCEPAMEQIETKVEPKPDQAATAVPETSLGEEDLRAVFVRDSVQDGTILPPNQFFDQTWVLRNEGSAAWPVGCSVKFVGGDYMGHVDSAHPAGISELVSASQSSFCSAPLAPGQEFPFTVLLRTPTRPGRIISYWRLTTPDGLKFGHRLWCEVNVRPVANELKTKLDVPHIEHVEKEQENSSGSSSTMIFPKLEKESPSSSIHEQVQVDKVDAEDGFEDCADDYEWDASESGFMTDEEYDILDASDEELLEPQQQKVAKK